MQNCGRTHIHFYLKLNLYVNRNSTYMLSCGTAHLVRYRKSTYMLRYVLRSTYMLSCVYQPIMADHRNSTYMWTSTYMQICGTAHLVPYRKSTYMLIYMLSSTYMLSCGMAHFSATPQSYLYVEVYIPHYSRRSFGANISKTIHSIKLRWCPLKSLYFQLSNGHDLSSIR